MVKSSEVILCPCKMKMPFLGFFRLLKIFNKSRIEFTREKFG
jgi:hypothetical protein